MIKIQDNTIRDGMQQHGIKKSYRTKLLILKELSNLSIPSIEVGMCTTKEDEINILEYRKVLNKNQEIVILTRIIEEDIKRVINLNIKNKVIKLLIPVSKLHIKHKLNITREEYLNKIINCLKILFSSRICVDVVLEDFTRTDINEWFWVLHYAFIRAIILSLFVGFLPLYFFKDLGLNTTEFIYILSCYTISGYLASKYLIEYLNFKYLSEISLLAFLVLFFYWSNKINYNKYGIFRYIFRINPTSNYKRNIKYFLFKASFK
ncbi:hypothetical protein [Staphylococcus capitis]|uniref:hypothetical protein n=1 Tax=Staphylococcus capitis TaxID=29388 RepID=UPI00345B9362